MGPEENKNTSGEVGGAPAGGLNGIFSTPSESKKSAVLPIFSSVKKTEETPAPVAEPISVPEPNPAPSLEPAPMSEPIPAQEPTSAPESQPLPSESVTTPDLVQSMPESTPVEPAPAPAEPVPAPVAPISEPAPVPSPEPSPAPIVQPAPTMSQPVESAPQSVADLANEAAEKAAYEEYLSHAPDIVLEKEKKPLDKKIVAIIAAAAVAVVAIIITVILIINNINNSGSSSTISSPKAAFEDFYNYYQKGPENLAEIDANSFFLNLQPDLPFALAIANTDNSIIAPAETTQSLYMEQLSSKYDMLKDKVTSISDTIDDTTFSLLYDFVAPSKTAEEITSIFLDEGYASATESINNLYDTENLDERLIEIANLERSFYLEYLNLYRIYAVANCAEGNFIGSSQCVTDAYGSSYTASNQELITQYKYSELLDHSFELKDALEDIFNSVRAKVGA